MTIPEAIRRLSDQVDLLTEDKEYPLESALKLGIGALQQIAQMRLLGISPIAEGLPGETEESRKEKRQ